MNELFKKEQELIKGSLSDRIEESLSNNFITQNHRKVILIKSVSIENFNIDIDKSELRKEIIITDIDVSANVNIEFGEGAYKIEKLDIHYSDRIKVIFDWDSRLYKIDDNVSLSPFDVTRF